MTVLSRILCILCCATQYMVISMAIYFHTYTRTYSYHLSKSTIFEDEDTDFDIIDTIDEDVQLHR